MSTEHSMVQKILVHQNQNQNRYCQPSPSIHIAHRFTLYILSTLCVHKIDTDTLKCTNEEILIKCPSFCQWFKPSKTGRKGNFIFGLIFLVAGITVHQYIGVLNCRNALSHCCHFLIVWLLCYWEKMGEKFNTFSFKHHSQKHGPCRIVWKLFTPERRTKYFAKRISRP